MTRPETTRLVMKFGGTSMGDLERIRRAARIIAAEAAKGKQIAVVVSAMAGKTNELVAWCRAASALHDAREYDAVVASGEQVTSGLLAITLEGMGVSCMSVECSTNSVTPVVVLLIVVVVGFLAVIAWLPCCGCRDSGLRRACACG
jgi:aspartokinase